jgi:hypothetical protein
MPREVTKDGDLFRAFWITGPTHNLLRLAFAKSGSVNAEIIVADLRSNEQVPNRVSATQVEQWVNEAIQQFNAENGSQIAISRIEFCRDDSPQREIYHHLVKLIVEEYVKQAEM